MNVATRYSRSRHAAHTSHRPGEGWDLEVWTVTVPESRGEIGMACPVRTEAIPPDAEYHSGTRLRDGRQEWRFVRPAPLTGTCAICEARRVDPGQRAKEGA